MASVNKCIIVGNLGADPETKSFQNGGKICNLRVACSESWKDKNSGEKKERTEWISVSIQSDGLAGIAERFLKKGSKVYLEGQLRTRKWQDQSGNDRYSTEVVLSGPGAVLTMLDGPQQGGQQSTGNGNGSRTQRASTPNFGGGFGDDLDDAPFMRGDGIW